MRNYSPNIKEIPLSIVGGNAFGRYKKISTEETFNMMITTTASGLKALVPYSGHQKILDFGGGGEGRGLYTSIKYNHLFAVVNDGLFTISPNNGVARIGTLETSTGDVFIDGNDATQVALVDGLNIYTFDYSTNFFQKVPNVDFLPTYITFQDGYFIAPDNRSNQWRLSDFNNGNLWLNDSSHVGLLQTKPDICMATQSFNRQVLVFGKTTTEIWYDTGAQLFPYQRNNYYSIDYGCINAATIAVGSIQEGAQLTPIICWLAFNEKSGPTIMYSMGGQPAQLSDDGINFRIEQLEHPEICYGFMFRQAGHVFYQIVWPSDNLSYAYDFTVKQFYTVTDENLDHHIAKRMAFFNNIYYFLSLNDAALYESNADFPTYNGNEIPRIRILAPFRDQNASRWIVNYTDLTMEQGEFNPTPQNTGTLLNQNTYPAVDFAISKDGGESYSNYLRKDIRLLAKRQNRFRYWNLGSANDWRYQYRFYGFDRFIITDGVAGVYQ